MKIYRDLSSEIITGTVTTIGIFDGVHKAHQEIIKRLNELSDQYNTESLLVTLWPHPRYVLNKDAESLKLLSTLDEKLELLEGYGLKNVLIIPFDKIFASTSYDKFIQRIIVNRLQTKHLVVGYNHQFGKNRQGNYENLIEFAARFGFKIEQLPKVEVNGNIVSSSSIREHLCSGNLDLAAEMLGHTVQVRGKVVHGNKLGRQLGFPTANIDLQELYKLLPADGVYAITASVGDENLQGMMNIGSRPTVNYQGNKVIEANFFNFDRDIYDKHILINFKKRIRDEKKFSSLEELKAQIEKDKQETIKYFNH